MPSYEVEAKEPYDLSMGWQMGFTALAALAYLPLSRVRNDQLYGERIGEKLAVGCGVQNACLRQADPLLVDLQGSPSALADQTVNRSRIAAKVDKRSLRRAQSEIRQGFLVTGVCLGQARVVVVFHEIRPL